MLTEVSLHNPHLDTSRRKRAARDLPPLPGPAIGRLGAVVTPLEMNELAMRCRACGWTARSSQDDGYQTHRKLRNHWADTHPAELLAMDPPTTTVAPKVAKPRPPRVYKPEPSHWTKVDHPPKPCERCGVEFKPIRSDQRWCSAHCRKGRGGPVQPIVCLADGCERTFTPMTGQQRFCTQACRMASSRGKARVLPVVAAGSTTECRAVDCQVTFATARVGLHMKAFCSRGCKSRHGRWLLGQNVGEGPKNCVECDRPLLQAGAGQKRSFCGPLCSARNRRGRAKN